MSPITSRAATAIALTLVSLPAHASGYFSLDNGIRALGRGGAYAVGADDLSAQYYNPAALSHIDGPVAQLSLAAVHQLVTFDRLDSPDYAFDPVKNSALPFIVPNIGVASKLGTEDLTLAVGLYTPYAPTYKYPEDGGQRYSLIEAMMVATTVGPSASYRVGDILSLGAGVGWSVLAVDQSLKTSISDLPTDNPAFDTMFEISVLDPFALAWNAGFIIEPEDGPFAIGASITGPTAFEARGSVTGDFTENELYTGEGALAKVIETPSASDDDATLALTLPMVIKAGVVVRPSDTVELEVDFVYQMWSVLQEFVITDFEMTIETTGEPMVVTDDVGLPANMNNAWSVRAGTEIDTSEKVALRLGTFYESSAVDDSYRSVFMPDAPKLGYGLGASWVAHDRWTLDFGLSQAFAFKSELTRSLAYQVRVESDGDVGSGTTVGNGDFGFVTTIFGLSASWALK